MMLIEGLGIRLDRKEQRTLETALLIHSLVAPCLVESANMSIRRKVLKESASISHIEHVLNLRRPCHSLIKR